MARKKGNLAMIGLTANRIMNMLINPNKADAIEQEATQNLLKLLCYTDTDSYKDPTEDEDLTLEDVRTEVSPIGDKVTVVPRLPNENDEKECKIVILFDDFYVSDNNKFMANNVMIDVLVPLDYWLTGSPLGRALRVFLIMDEIAYLVNGEQFEGLGILELKTISSVALSEDLVGYSMKFKVHDFNNN